MNDKFIRTSKECHRRLKRLSFEREKPIKSVLEEILDEIDTKPKRPSNSWTFKL